MFKTNVMEFIHDYARNIGLLRIPYEKKTTVYILSINYMDTRRKNWRIENINYVNRVLENIIKSIVHNISWSIIIFLKKYYYFYIKI